MLNLKNYSIKSKRLHKMQIRIRYFKKKNMKNKGIQGIFGNCFLKQFYILQNKKNT